MSHPVNPTPPAPTTSATQALAVLRDVQGPFHPGTRLFAAHRRDIVAALAQAGIREDSDVHACIAETLATAAAYEADGMYAFLPTWDLLLSRVARLATDAAAATSA